MTTTTTKTTALTSALTTAFATLPMTAHAHLTTQNHVHPHAHEHGMMDMVSQAMGSPLVWLAVAVFIVVAVLAIKTIRDKS